MQAVTSLTRVIRPWRSRSYLTLIDVMRTDPRGAIPGLLEFNEMSGRIEIDRKPIKDSDASLIRSELERLYPGGVDKHGNETGLQFAISDVYAACEQIASENPYHPVRSYVSRLEWDKVPRLDWVATSLLGAEDTPLNRAIMKRFFISAIARAFTPGCKVDTVPILIGKQGARKSTFLRTIAGDWFVDTAVDIHDKDSYQVLRRAWIYEWSELEVLRRAKDAATAKAFLSSQMDTYRPSYGRFVIDVPRGCVFVGTTNADEFLVDESGNRRFWPIPVGDINIELAIEWRDQLWAEAAVLHREGEKAWLNSEESTALADVHSDHMVSDPWESIIYSWANSRLAEFSTGEVLEHAVGKPRGQWSRGDEMRVASVLKRGDWIKKKRSGKEARTWSK